MEDSDEEKQKNAHMANNNHFYSFDQPEDSDDETTGDFRPPHPTPHQGNKKPQIKNQGGKYSRT